MTRQKRQKRKKSVRAKTKVKYHGRTGHPVLHYTKNRKRPYVMVRKKGGGTKRLYLDTKRAKREVTEGHQKLLQEARHRKR